MESTTSSKIDINGSDIATSASNISNSGIFNLSYWFGNPSGLNFLKIVLVTVVVISVLVCALAAFLAPWRMKLTPPQKKFFNKIGWYLLAFTLIGWLLLTARVFSVPYLSIRFLWVVWFLVLAVFCYFQGRFYLTNMPKQTAQYQSYLLKKRYFPRKKKSRR